MDKKGQAVLPLQSAAPPRSSKSHVWKIIVYALLLQFAFYFLYIRTYYFGDSVPNGTLRSVIRPDVVAHRSNLTERCRTLRAPAGPPPSFDPASRLDGHSDRFVPGTRPVLIRDARIWTGHDDGKEVIHGDVLLDRGLVVGVGKLSEVDYEEFKELSVVDAKGRWVTPGLVDLHSHIAVDSAPHLNGAADTNSRKAPILPWIRSIDGMNTHDQAFELTVSGGVSTAQILPGSAGNIGGQAFVIKLRPTDEKSTISKVVEPPETLIKSSDNVTHVHWRHMKHACGENQDRVYNQVRMDAAWNFREAYHTANEIKIAQDAFCDAVEAEYWDVVDGKDIPEDYQWESLVDVLRGKVRLSVHCYEAVDLDMMVRLSNEFQFHITSFHHGGDTHLVPDLLKKTFGGPPTVALFASNARKKREAYRNSEFAPRILASHDIPVVMKSDHPVLNSRHLLFEAQLAHYYGLSTELALSSVTTTSAKAAGLSHRVGFLSKGYDADVVMWDSHPLSLGATPAQVFIDGIPQLKDPHVLHKPDGLQRSPRTPNFDREARETVEFDGLPPLRRHHRFVNGEIIKLVNVSTVWAVNDMHDDHLSLDDIVPGASHDVFLQDGTVICVTKMGSRCDVNGDLSTQAIHEIDLQGGALLPGLVSFGAPLGLEEIAQEPSTNDGSVPDALTGSVPAIAGGTNTIIRAVDGLAFNGRNLLHAYRNGVTKAITAPSGGGFIQGLSTEIFTGAENAIQRRAILQEETALHITISHSVDASISTQIATLRQLLLQSDTPAWKRVRERDIPLVVNVDSADIMSTLLRLKAEFRHNTGNDFDMTFTGGSEAHLIAEDIARAGVSVIVTMPRPYPGNWESQRILAGAPLTHDNVVMELLEAGVNVGIGVIDGYAVRNTRFEVAWLALNSFGEIGRWEALALVTINVQRALRTHKQQNVMPSELVAYQGGDWMDFQSRVVGVFSNEQGIAEIF
ncbi:hypothetical protein Agabi119p4_2739 [Agaricus bisporus var. burnettii]|uniref:Amidohydrolase-related domain-containing protein n=1 Tax=Agaricus bisporus var. burnettii TaxID=192524 RepID=A0A8H7F610_AGABI|nr:hypothetical protein Agabi119p4_2739 [Agaricus bisporus var. burnettii]